jgi:hypothetical protein
MARFLPHPGTEPRAPQPRSRGLYWSASPAGHQLLRMRTWRKQWPSESWHGLLGSLAAARNALCSIDQSQRPFPLEALRAYDDGAALTEVEGEAGLVEWVEYDVRVPSEAAPLAGCFVEQAGHAGRRSMAADVLRTLLSWERSGLAYRTMGPDGVLHAAGRIHFDMLSSVAPLDADSLRRQRRGAAACLVFLLAPWPYAWSTVLAGTTPVLRGDHDERSAWDIAASAVAALLHPDPEPERWAEDLREKAELLTAAARLDRRFPAWPWSAPEVAR